MTPSRKPKRKAKQKAPEVPEVPKYCLYIDYAEHSSGGDRESDEPFSSRSDERTHVSFLGVYREIKNKFFYDSAEVSKELYEAAKVYLVVVRYQDGDTFGTSYGNWRIVDHVATEAEAQAIGISINNNTYPGYQFWNGYFSRLEGVEIHEFTIQDSDDNTNSPIKVIKH